MAFAIADRVWEQASLAGTGAVTLSGTAVAGGYQSFLAGWGASGVGWYCIFGGNQWEVGEGTLNVGGTTLTRTTVFNGSSGAGVAVAFTSGVKNIIGVVPAARVGFTVDGTVGAPAHSFQADTDTGFYRIGANRIGLALGGVNLIDAQSTAVAITVQGVQGLVVGRQGFTNPAFAVDSSAVNSITGVRVSAAATGGGVSVTAIGETNVALTLAAAGSGNVVLSSGSGNVTTAQPMLVTNATASTSTTTGALVVTGGVGIGGTVQAPTARINRTTALGTEPFTVGQLSASTFAAGFSCVDRGFFHLASAASGFFEFFTQNTQANTVGTISFTTTATAYNTSSDARLKEGEAPIENVRATIEALRPYEHGWRGKSGRAFGFFAQELHAVVPQAVTPGTGAPGVKGFVPWQADVAKLVPHHTAALQDLYQLHDALAARIDRMEPPALAA